MNSWLAVTHGMMKDIFINSDTTMCKYGYIHRQLQPVPQGALMTTDKLYQYGILLNCATTDIPEH